MFRISKALNKSKIIQIHLYQIPTLRIHETGQSLIYKKVRQRELCPQRPPPPPPPPKSRAWLYKTLAALVATGGFIVYAKQNPELRDWLTIYAPWFDNLIDVLYQESDTYDQSIKKILVYSYSKVHEMLNAPPRPKECETDGLLKYLSFKGIKKLCDKKKEKEKNKDDDDDEKPKHKGHGEHKEHKEHKEDTRPSGIIECKPVDKTKSQEEVTKEKEKEAEVVNVHNINAILKCMETAGKEIVSSYEKATKACRDFQEMAGEEMQHFNHNSVQKMEECIQKRLEIVEDNMEKLHFAKKKMKTLGKHASCIQLSEEEKNKYVKQYYKIMDEQEHAKNQFKVENEKALSEDQCFQLMKEKFTKFLSEIKVIGNGLDFNQDKLDFRGEADILLYHAMRYEKMLVKEMMEKIESNERRIHKGEARMPPQTEETLKKREALTKKALTKHLNDYSKEIKKRSEVHHQRNEKMLEEALKKQTDKQQEIFDKKLQARLKELEDNFDHLISEQVNAEKAVFKKDLEDMRKQLRETEAKLCAQLEKEADVRRARELYSASLSILHKASSGEGVAKIDSDITTIKNVASPDDELTHSVINALPDSVIDEGIVPEGILFKQFNSMERQARDVALVERNGGPLPVYILSYIQSLLLSFPISGIPTVEAEKPPDPPYDDLDTFDKLQRARYWIAHRNLKQAVQYVQELQGASFGVARDWLKKAQTHLEAKQAAEAIAAHAAAQTLKHV